MNNWHFLEGSSTSSRVQRQRLAPGHVMTVSPKTTWAGCIFFTCLSMRQDCTTAYRVTTCTTATRLFLVVWHVWRFFVRYNNQRRRRRLEQNDSSFLFFFFHFQSKNSAETRNERSPRSKENFGAKKKITYLSSPKITLLIGPRLP